MKRRVSLRGGDHRFQHVARYDRSGPAAPRAPVAHGGPSVLGLEAVDGALDGLSVSGVVEQDSALNTSSWPTCRWRVLIVVHAYRSSNAQLGAVGDCGV